MPPVPIGGARARAEPMAGMTLHARRTLGESSVAGLSAGRRCRALLAIAVALGSLFAEGARAQGNSAAMHAPVLVVDACKRDVLRYQANVDLVRKSLGERAAAELEGRFLSREQWDSVLLSEGYCGLSRRLRERHLTR